MRHCVQILGVEDAIARNIFWMMIILTLMDGIPNNHLGCINRWDKLPTSTVFHVGFRKTINVVSFSGEVSFSTLSARGSEKWKVMKSDLYNHPKKVLILIIMQPKKCFFSQISPRRKAVFGGAFLSYYTRWNLPCFIGTPFFWTRSTRAAVLCTWPQALEAG